MGESDTTAQARYRYDPARFVAECFTFRPNEQPAPYQLDALNAFAEHKRVAVRGPHGLGKTALASWVVLWGVLTSDDVKVVTTASAWRQLIEYLWPEIHKWYGRLRWDVIGRPALRRDQRLSLALKAGPSAAAFAVASKNATFIEGAHAQRVIYVFDEAKGIPALTWDAAEGAFSTAGNAGAGEAYALAISTPGAPSGRFYEISARRPGYEDWFPVHVTLEQAIRAGRLGQDWADARRRQWGETSSVYQNRVLGEFAAEDENSVIPLAWVEAAIERWHAWRALENKGPFIGVGVDVARYGEDKTVLALMVGPAIATLRKFGKLSTMQTVGKVGGVLRAYNGKAVVDVVGIGAGVVDRLREQNLGEIIAFSAGSRTDDLDRSGELGFVNMRSAAWWGLRESLDPANNPTLCLPPDNELIGDLTTPRWRVLSGGRIAIETKDEIRKRINRSTDCGDAVIQIVWGAYRSEVSLGIIED